METTGVTPANAENTAPVEVAEPDGGATETKGDGSAPSVPEADTPVPPKRDAVQERFDKLTREKYDNARLADQRGYELERERAERQRLEAEIAKLRNSETPQVAPDKFPTLEQFGYDEGKFMAAVIARTQGMTEAAKAAARETAKEEIQAERNASRQQEAAKNWAKKQAEFIKSKPDYVEKVLEARTLPISREIQMELQESDLGPQIAYYLVENPEKAAAIMQLPLKEQLKEIGRIEARLESTKTPAKPAVSQAPPPAEKIESNESVVSVRVDTAESDGLSDREWTRRRNAQEQARLRKLRGG
jgi:signal recognition particle GTPase